MIVPIKGKVTYSITLDPTVWIFDERKVLLEDAFGQGKEDKQEENKDNLVKAAKNFDRAILNPPINKGLTKKEGEEILKNSYIMPLHYFLKNAKLKDDANHATLVQKNGEAITMELNDLEKGYLLFALNGKPVKDGPIYFLYHDGSNKDNPIKNIKEIVIN